MGNSINFDRRFAESSSLNECGQICRKYCKNGHKIGTKGEEEKESEKEGKLANQQKNILSGNQKKLAERKQKNIMDVLGLKH